MRPLNGFDDDVFYTASLFVFTSRMYKQPVRHIAGLFSLEAFKAQVDWSDCAHCLVFEESAEDMAEIIGLTKGSYDDTEGVEWDIPDHTALGWAYARTAYELTHDTEDSPFLGVAEDDMLYILLCSDFSDSMADYNAAFFFASPEEQAWRFVHDGYILEGETISENFNPKEWLERH